MPVPTPPTFSQVSWNAGEDVLNSDFNQLVNYVLALGAPIDDDRLSSDPGQIKQRVANFTESFKVSAANLGVNLTLNYNGGVIKLDSGLVAIVAPNSISAPPNGISWVYCLNGTVLITAVGSPIPAAGFLMAKVTTGLTAVTAVEDLRAPYQERRNPDNRIIVAQKSTNTPLTIGGVPLGIPGWSASLNTGNWLDVNSGEITLGETITNIRVDASCRIVCDTPATLQGKLSLYAGGIELKVLAELSTVSVINASILTLSGFFETQVGETIGAGTKLTLQVQVREGGTNTRVIGGNRNTEIIIRRW